MKEKATMSFKQVLLLVLVGAIAFIYSCKEIGAVPEFQYEFNDFDDIEIDAVDTASLAVEDIEITEGSMTNEAADNLAANVESDPVQAANTAAAVDSAVSQDQQTFWNSQTPESVEADIEAGNSDLAAQVESAIESFQNDPVLSQFLPTVSGPSGGRVTGRIESNTSLSQLIQVIAKVGNEDDCRKAAQDAFDLVKEGFDAHLADELAKIATRYTNQLQVLTDKAVVLRAAANERHTTRKAAFKATFDSFKANIASAVGNGVLTAAQGQSLNLINIMIYGFNVHNSKVLLASENTAIDTKVTTETTKLDTANAALKKAANDNYKAALSQAQQKLNTAQNACHNQGSNTGG